MKITQRMLVAPLIGTLLIASGLSVIATSSHSSASIAGLNMGTSSTYGALASSAITSATPSSISGTAGGDIGIGGATAHSGVITHSGAEVLGGISLTALSDAQSAFNDVRTSTGVGVELGGTTLTPGAYSNGTLGITGTLTLDAQNDPNAVFIFRAASTLTTAASSSISLINGAQACNVYWQVGSSATLGASSTMVGHVIASASISTGATTTVNGQLIALTAAVTLGGTSVVNNLCTSTPSPTPTPTPTSTTTATPTPTATTTQAVTNNEAATPAQTDSISGASDSTGPVAGGNTETIAGVFNAQSCPISNISVGGIDLAVGSWITTPTTITLIMPPHRAGVFPIDIYNGCAPTLSSISYTYVASTPVPTPMPMGILHIIKVVINTHSGTSVARDFDIIVRHNGEAVPLSPAPGTSGVGWALSLAPGIYDLSEAPTPGYRGVWSGPITPGGRVVITANHDISVTRTNYDLGIKSSAVPTTPTTVSVAPSTSATSMGTINGGILPKTSTPWGNYLVVGGVLILLGALVYETRKHRLSKKS